MTGGARRHRPGPRVGAWMPVHHLHLDDVRADLVDKPFQALAGLLLVGDDVVELLVRALSLAHQAEHELDVLAEAAELLLRREVGQTALDLVDDVPGQVGDGAQEVPDVGGRRRPSGAQQHFKRDDGVQGVLGGEDLLHSGQVLQDLLLRAEGHPRVCA
jgi:hypothetical protein